MPPDSREGRSASEASALQGPAFPQPTIAVPADTLAAVTDLIGSAAAREHAAEARGFARGETAGYRRGHADGWAAAEADMASYWAEVAVPLSRGRSLIAEGWERRVAAAVAEERGAAAAHWRAFHRRAEQCRPELRTVPEAAALRMDRRYPSRGAA